MLKKTLKIIYSGLTILFFVTLIPAFAMEGSPKMKAEEAMGNQVSDKVEKLQNRLDTVQEAAADRVQKREERMEEHCSNVSNRLVARLEQYSNNKDTHVEYYGMLSEKLSDIISSLSEKGYDTTALEEDLAALEALVQDYVTEYDLLIALLQDSQGYVCGESAGDFVSGVKAARDQLKVVHAQRLEIRKFYKDEIREDIKDLRDQTPSIEVNELTEE